MSSNPMNSHLKADQKLLRQQAQKDGIDLRQIREQAIASLPPNASTKELQDAIHAAVKQAVTDSGDQVLLQAYKQVHRDKVQIRQERQTSNSQKQINAPAVKPPDNLQEPIPTFNIAWQGGPIDNRQDEINVYKMELKFVLSQHDTNHDGKLSQNELQEAANATTKTDPLNTQKYSELKNLLAQGDTRLDTNRNGQLDLDTELESLVPPR